MGGDGGGRGGALVHARLHVVADEGGRGHHRRPASRAAPIAGPPAGDGDPIAGDGEAAATDKLLSGFFGSGQFHEAAVASARCRSPGTRARRGAQFGDCHFERIGKTGDSSTPSRADCHIGKAGDASPPSCAQVAARPVLTEGGKADAVVASGSGVGDESSRRSTTASTPFDSMPTSGGAIPEVGGGRAVDSGAANGGQPLLSQRSAASSSGAGGDEVEEMRAMVLDHCKHRLRECHGRLRRRWRRVVAALPPHEASAPRSSLSQAPSLRDALGAARATSDVRASLALALLWERCRLRAEMALAVKLGRPGALRESIALAEDLGLAARMERDFCERSSRISSATCRRRPSSLRRALTSRSTVGGTVWLGGGPKATPTRPRRLVARGRLRRAALLRRPWSAGPKRRS